MFFSWGNHQPVWGRDTPEVRYPKLNSDLQVDVVVVGAGITGLTTALNLRNAGLSVVVLTESKVGEGASGASSAHVTEIPDLPLKELIVGVGRDRAKQVLSSLHHSLNQIEKTVKQNKLHCHFQRISAYHFTEDEKSQSSWQEQREAAIDLGLDPQLNSSIKLPFSVQSMMEFKNQILLHPRQYLVQLAQCLTKARGRIFEQTRVVEIKEGGVQTHNGFSIEARHVVLATHSPLGVYLSLQTRVAPYFTYMMGVRLLHPAPQGMFWDFSKPYFYFRSLHEEDQKFLVVGGRDHKTGQVEDTKSRYRELESYVRERFEVADVSYYWGQEVFESVDGLPYIGRIPLTDRIWTATGFAGCGMSFGTLAGDILSNLIQGRSHPFADLYDPARMKARASVARFAKENANVARWLLKDWLSRDEQGFISEIPRGSGSIVEGPFQKVAIYKDFRGGLHALSPVCHHLGGLVHWNEAEKTWDCPCHGSRYEPEGRVMCGPSLQDLEPVILDDDLAEGLDTITPRDLPASLLRNPKPLGEGWEI